MGGVEVLNLFSADGWETESERPRYRHRVTPVGRRLGAQLLGGSLYKAILRNEPTLDYWDGED
jgi:hypothetical protein